MGTSRVQTVKVSVLNHSDVAEEVSGFQELDKLPQCVPRYCRLVLQEAPSADGGIKHPLWNFQRSCCSGRLQGATKNSTVVFIDLLEDVDCSAIPRMPAVLDDVRFSNVGFI